MNSFLCFIKFNMLGGLNIIGGIKFFKYNQFIFLISTCKCIVRFFLLHSLRLHNFGLT